MLNERKSFVHVLVFKCPGCDGPIASARSDGKRSLEEIDGMPIAATCLCGWSGELLGIKAAKHWVEPWER